MLTMRGAGRIDAERGPSWRSWRSSAKQPVIRQIGYVSLMNVDGSADKAWALATKSVPALRDFLGGDADDPRCERAGRACIRRSSRLLEKLPANLATKAARARGCIGRYVRIELPGKKRTLTLAEVEVYSDGRNIARGQGIADRAPPTAATPAAASTATRAAPTATAARRTPRRTPPIPGGKSISARVRHRIDRHLQPHRRRPRQPPRRLHAEDPRRRPQGSLTQLASNPRPRSRSV